MMSPIVMLLLALVVGSWGYQPSRFPVDSRSGIETSKNSPQPSSFDRRSFLQTLGIGGVALYVPTFAAAAASEEGVSCLQDLPPKPPNSIRLYLCRHGQTENNRLGIVQGSRVNPPLNDNGVLMAQRLGMALDSVPLDKMYHSPLLRAKQTAQTATSQMRSPPPSFRSLENLKEFDFGPSREGKPAGKQPGKVKIYSQWSAGFIDERPPGGGETCREMLQRSADFLSTVVADSANNGHVAAVSHSAYIRILLAMVQGDVPLATAMMTQQDNANINVLDIDTTSASTRNAKSILVGGPFSQAPQDFSLSLPQSRVVRVNEHRHLEGVRTA